MLISNRATARTINKDSFFKKYNEMIFMVGVGSNTSISLSFSNLGYNR